MTEFTLHNETSAPDESKLLLEHSKQVFGFVPNLHGVMAEAPGVLDAYKKVHEFFLNSSFDKDEPTMRSIKPCVMKRLCPMHA